MRHRNESGFTLIEVTVSMALMALVLIPVLSLLITNSRSIITAREDSNIQTEAQLVMTSLKNNCLYTKSIQSCKVGGIEHMNEVNYSIPDDTPYIIIVRQPIKASPGYKDIKYEYKTDNGGEFYIDGTLISKGAKVKVSPIYPGTDAANKTFAKAVGINVDISLSSTHPGTKKTSKVDNLSNVFYFRNSGNMQFMSYGDRTAGGDEPAPYPTANPSAGGGGSSGGGGGDSGEGGNTGGDSGGSGDNGGNTGGDNGGSTGGDNGGSTGGDNGGNTGGDNGGNTGGNTGGDNGGNTGGDNGGGSTEPETPPNPPAGPKKVLFATALNGFPVGGNGIYGIKSLTKINDSTVHVSIDNGYGGCNVEIDISKEPNGYKMIRTNDNGLVIAEKFDQNQTTFLLTDDQIAWLESKYALRLDEYHPVVKPTPTPAPAGGGKFVQCTKMTQKGTNEKGVLSITYSGNTAEIHVSPNGDWSSDCIISITKTSSGYTYSADGANNSWWAFGDNAGFGWSLPYVNERLTSEQISWLKNNYGIILN